MKAMQVSAEYPKVTSRFLMTLLVPPPQELGVVPHGTRVRSCKEP
jgi:hypothetical protein